MINRTETLPVIRTVAKTLHVTTLEYPVARVQQLSPDDLSELRRAYATSLAMGSEGEPVEVTVKVTDPATTQFVNLSFQIDGCWGEDNAGHWVEKVFGRTTGGSNRTELLFVDGVFQLATLVSTECVESDSRDRS
jgi:hypothetical protein